MEVPEDAEIKNVTYDVYRQALMVVVYHTSFDVVDDGSEIPVHACPSTLDLRCVTIEQSDRERLLSERLSHFQEKCMKLQQEVSRLSGIMDKVYAVTGHGALLSAIEDKDLMISQLTETVGELNEALNTLTAKETGE